MPPYCVRRQRLLKELLVRLPGPLPALFLGLFLGLVIADSPTVLGQSDEEKTRQQIEVLQGDIQRISAEIKSASGRKNTLQQQLRQADIDLGKIQRSIATARRDISVQQDKLAALKQQRKQLYQARDQQQSRIGAELKTAWQMARQGQIKVLLNQESPDTVARVSTYYRYFFEARNKLLQGYRDTLAQLNTVEQDIASTVKDLEQQKLALQQKQADLQQAQHTRQQAIASINASISSKDQQLKQKQRDRQELEKLLQAIEKAVVNLQLPDSFQDFNSARGTMPWPVPGRASSRFGDLRNNGKMRWQGVTIPAAEGTVVKAIHHGRVVYADWLRGSGLLIIIDHGDGYMSLYANNQSLLRDVGEWVTAGTPISTVGSSGGQERPALYFEIRHQGKPTNPARWCRR